MPSEPTQRELMMLQNIADGFTCQDIARELILSEHTVRTHLRNVTRKLEAKSRTQAVAIALRRGLIR